MAQHTLLKTWIFALVLAFSAVSLTACCGGGSSGPTVESSYKGSSKKKKKKKKDKKKKKKDKKKKDKKKKKKKKDKEPKPVDGAKFNKFFPDKDFKGTKRTFTQEKTGFAEAKFTKDGKDWVTVSISDTANNPSARDKFEEKAKDEVKGYPMMHRGKNSTMVLVKDRFQVKVMSKELDKDKRVKWLKEVDLDGLKKLAKKSK